MNNDIFKSGVNLPENHPKKTIDNLLRVCAAHIHNDLVKPGLYVNYLLLIKDSEDYNIDEFSIYFEYWYCSDEQQAISQSNIDWLDELKIANKTEEISYEKSKNLSRCTVRNPQDKNRNDVVRLLYKTADVIESLKDIEVLDLIMHNVIDKDALDHPFISFYYR